MDLSSKIGKSSFTWADALTLRRTNEIAVVNKSQIFCIEKIAMKLDAVMCILGNNNITITSWFRPIDYNILIGGSPTSAHCSGMAVDFLYKDINSNTIREMLVPRLDELNIRMERLANSCWVHIDCRTPNQDKPRYFIP